MSESRFCNTLIPIVPGNLMLPILVKYPCPTRFRSDPSSLFTFGADRWTVPPVSATSGKSFNPLPQLPASDNGF